MNNDIVNKHDWINARGGYRVTWEHLFNILFEEFVQQQRVIFNLADSATRPPVTEPQPQRSYAPIPFALTDGDWCYSYDFSAVCVVVNHKVKAVADFGMCDLPEQHNNAIIMAEAKNMMRVLVDIAANGACSETVHESRLIVERVKELVQ